MNTISLIPLSGIPAVSAGSDLTAVLLTALEDIAPKEGDLLVLTHKVLSKANGLTIALSDVRPRRRRRSAAPRARTLASWRSFWKTAIPSMPATAGS